MIHTISCVYNEEFLLPFYFTHYWWVDKFHILYDEDSTDKTLKILKEYQNKSLYNIEIIPFRFPDKMDDVLKAKMINELYLKISEEDNRGWVLNVDSDEFIFIDAEMINKIDDNYDVYPVRLYNVYRHKDEIDLSIKMPTREQRRHGVFDSRYNKPIIVRTGLEVAWGVGNHTLVGTARRFSSKGIKGAHWAMADPCFCVERRVKNRRDRQSQVNLEQGLTIQHHNITEEDVLRECEEHKEDPVLW